MIDERVASCADTVMLAYMCISQGKDALNEYVEHWVTSEIRTLSGEALQVYISENTRACIVFWHLFSEYIQTDVLLRSFSALLDENVSLSDMTDSIGERVPDYPCVECGELVLSDFNSFSVSEIRKWINLIESLMGMCSECKDKRDRRAWYSDYLKSDHWQFVRKSALKRAGYRCQICNSSKPLQVHHRTYERIGAELPTDVIAICDDCHRVFHENRRLSK